LEKEREAAVLAETASLPMAGSGAQKDGEKVVKRGLFKNVRMQGF